MKVSEIITAVRLCLDEEQTNFGDLQSDVTNNDTVFMDNIIRAKIGDALTWVCKYAPANLLVSGTASADGIVATKDYTPVIKDGVGVISLESTPLRVVRVKGANWHRGVLEPFSEDSDEFSMMWDDPENGTNDLPRAGIAYSSPPTLYVQPADGAVTVQTISYPSATSTDDSSDVAIPEKCKTSFIYYIAYLVMVAYENQAKATMCYTVAIQNLTTQTTKSNGNG